MSARSRAVVVVLVIALASAAEIGWWSTREGPARRPFGAVRVLTADPDVDLPYRLDIASDPGGCPGYTMRAPGPSKYAPTRSVDGSRSDAAIDLGGGAFILSVCLGPVSTVGEPRDLVAAVLAGDHPESPVEDVVLEQVGPIDEIVSAHGTGPALTSRVGSSLVTDFYVVHDGFVHAVGYLRPESVGDTYLSTVEAVLAGWSWT